MLNFFTKKEFLIDHLEGFVDIHNHILPGIDDGAKTVEESVELIRGFEQFGVTNFICTPHIMENYYPNDALSINNSLEILNQKLSQEGLENIKLRAAAEHMIDSNFENLLETNLIMPLASSYLLIEMSYLQASLNFNTVVEKIAEKKYFPILAHPERYIYLSRDINNYRKFKANGILLQLNLLSLGGFYGKDVLKTAIKLINANMIDFVSSDVHNERQLKSLKTITLTKKK